MSRVIKVRAWNNIDKIMCHMNEDGGASYWDGVYLSTVSLINDQLAQSSKYVWLQFTGLLDKNGVEIYEGDILTIHYDETQRENPMQVEYEVEDGAFRLNEYRNKRLYGQLPVNIEYQDRWEVLGNIYENPELINN